MEELNGEKRELERQLADFRRQLAKPERAQDAKDGLELERQELASRLDRLSGELKTKDEKISELNTLVEKQRKLHEGKVRDYEGVVASMEKELRQKNDDLDGQRKQNKQLRQDLDKTLSKEKLAELIQD